MCQSSRVSILVCLALVTACGAQDQPAGREHPDTAADENVAALATPPSTDLETVGSIGRVVYAFAPERLTRAEIRLDLPPGYDTAVWATKLIPAARAAMLGEEQCRYGSSRLPQTCTAEAEDGLALALLDRPLADYRQKFGQAGLSEATLEPAALADARGFQFTAEDGGTVTTYGFYPAGERVLLVAVRAPTRTIRQDPDIERVLDSLQLPGPE